MDTKAHWRDITTVVDVQRFSNFISLCRKLWNKTIFSTVIIRRQQNRDYFNELIKSEESKISPVGEEIFTNSALAACCSPVVAIFCRHFMYSCIASWHPVATEHSGGSVFRYGSYSIALHTSRILRLLIGSNQMEFSFLFSFIRSCKIAVPNRGRKNINLLRFFKFRLIDQG